MPVTTRETAFDVLRGMCVISMVISHVGGQYLEELTHWPRWIDGAMGFVLISGLVLGMVQRRVVDRAGPAAARSKVWRRAGLIYAAHIGLTLFALLVYELVQRPAAETSVTDRGGLPLTLAMVLTLQVQMQWLNILSLYAVLLAVVPLATWLLTAGRGWTLFATSAAVYLLSYLNPDATLPPVLNDGPKELNWGAWQALFFLGFAAGWHWRSRGVATAVRRPVAVAVAAVVTVGALAAAQLGVLSGAYADAPPRVFAKWDLGPATTVWTVAVVVVGYWAVRRAQTWLPGRVGAWALAFVGRRSLDAFVILGLALILLPALAGTPPAGRIGDPHTLAILAAITTWAALRDRATLLALLPARRPAASPGVQVVEVREEPAVAQEPASR